MTDHEIEQSSEASRQDVFDILAEASSPQVNTHYQYHIGDGLAVEVGWVANIVDGGNPGLIVSLQDSRLGRRISLSVGQQETRYSRSTQSLFTGLGWLAATREERHIARLMTRRQSSVIPTSTLELVAQAVSNRERYTGQYMSDEMLQDQISAEPTPNTDIAAIRSMIQEFSAPLD